MSWVAVHGLAATTDCVMSTHARTHTRPLACGWLVGDDYDCDDNDNDDDDDDALRRLAAAVECVHVNWGDHCDSVTVAFPPTDILIFRLTLFAQCCDGGGCGGSDCGGCGVSRMFTCLI